MPHRRAVVSWIVANDDEVDDLAARIDDALHALELIHGRRAEAMAGGIRHRQNDAMAAKSGKRQIARPIVLPALRQFAEADASAPILGRTPCRKKRQYCCATQDGAALQRDSLAYIVLQRTPTLGHLRSNGIDANRLYLSFPALKRDGDLRPPARALDRNVMDVAASAHLRETHEIPFEFLLLGGVDGDASRHALCPSLRREPK